MSIVSPLSTYLHLARMSELRRRPLVRDRLLVIAAALAADGGLWRVSAFCRDKVLAHNHSHMLQRWPTVEEAMEHDDFLLLVRQLIRRFPMEKVEQMMVQLGVDHAEDRKVYFNDEEYAAATWGLTLGDFDEMFGTGDYTE